MFFSMSSKDCRATTVLCATVPTIVIGELLIGWDFPGSKQRHVVQHDASCLSREYPLHEKSGARNGAEVEALSWMRLYGWWPAAHRADSTGLKTMPSQCQMKPNQ